MKFWVGVTDNSWFRFLAARGMDEVNFWQPSATPPFVHAKTGMPFFFKLKRPHNHIAGGGHFVTYSTLPLDLAWEVFGEKNGVPSIDALRAVVEPLSNDTSGLQNIGCTILANPFFLSQPDWFVPAGWASNIVRGKSYESNSGDGAEIWKSVSDRLQQKVLLSTLDQQSYIKDDQPKYGSPALIAPRLGQSSFRVLVTDAYKRRCAITGETTLTVLEAAHIVPYAREGSHNVQNGMLLRADFHRLFDAGLVSVTPEMRVKVSPRIREAFFNGKAYYRLNDAPLSTIPEVLSMRPDPDRLQWHFKNRFQS